MRSSHHLFALIKSMNKNEKGYFKKYAQLFVKGEENQYFKLFDVIDKQDAYDENSVKKKLKNPKMVRNFSFHKNYLYHLVLKTLKEYHSKDSHLFQLKDDLRSAEVLYRKGLYDQSKKILEKVKTRAEEMFQHTTYLEALQLEERMVRERIEMDVWRTYTEEKFHPEPKLLQLVKNFKLQKNTMYLTSLIIFEKEQLSADKKNIYDEIVNDPLVKEPTTDYFQKHYQLQIDGVKKVMGRHINTVPSLHKVLDYFESNPLLITETIHDHQFIVGISAHAYMTMKSRKNFDRMIARARKVLHEYESELTSSLVEKFDIRLHCWEMFYFVKNGEWEEAEEKLTLMLEIYDVKGESLDNFNYVLMLMCIIIYYFATEDFQEALRWIHIKTASQQFKDRAESIRIMRIFSFMVHLELKDETFLTSEARALDRYYKVSEKLNFEEEILAKYFLKIVRTDDEATRVQLFKSLKKDLSTKELKKEISATVSYVIDIYQWIDAKIQGIPYKDLTRKAHLGHKILGAVMK